MKDSNVVSIADYLPIISGPDIPGDDYSDFMEDLAQLGLKVKEFAKETGVSPGTVYSWRRHGVPIYAHKILDLMMRLHDAEIRLGKREA